MRIELQFFAAPSFSKYRDAALRKTIRPLEQRKTEHAAKIKSPAAFYPKWNSLDAREQEGCIKHWEKEIQTFDEQLRSARAEAERRGLL